MRSRLSPSILLFAFTMYAGSVSLCAQSSSEPKPAAQPMGEMKMQHPAGDAKSLTAATLKITFGEKSEEWTPQSFAQLDPHTAVDVYNSHAKVNQHYAGVLLSTLLTRVGVPDKPHGKEFRLYLVADGADGYQVVFSLGEVTPDVHEGTIIVADTLGTEPLGEGGAFQLVATGEKRPARWVRNLVSIRVLQAP